MPEPAEEGGGSLAAMARHLPIALLFSMAVQTGGTLLWAGGAAQRIAELEQRVDRQAGVAERLARLEAEAEGERAALGRIEAKLDGGRRR